MIGAVVVWKVEDTFKAAFDVDNYYTFIETQSEAAITKTGRLICLRQLGR